MNTHFNWIKSYLAPGLFLAGTSLVPGQWQKQTFELKEGWNAIYTHVDASHATIEKLAMDDGVGLAEPFRHGVAEVWMWRPKLSNMQYITTPEEPLDTYSRWTSWKSTDPAGSALKRMIGNAAFLVKVTQPVNWSIKGKPVPPRYQWTSTGLNFIGFSTPSTSAPVFSNFLNPVDGFGAGSQIFAYGGGTLSTNPSQLFTLNTSTVNRGQAYWIRANGYNRYYGPFELKLQDWSGVHFKDDLSSYRVVIENTTRKPLTVTMQLHDSEDAPVQQGIRSVAGTPPIIVRGAFQSETLTYDYETLGLAGKTWTLQPKDSSNDSVEIYLGVHWAQLTGNSGDLFAGILRFTDDGGYLQTDLPLSVTKPDTTGLWVGQATVNQVRHGMKTFRESIVKGQASAVRQGTQDNPVIVYWIKKQAVENKIIGREYHTSAAGYHLLQEKKYTTVSQGDFLWLPTVDENGTLLDDPASYWRAQPLPGPNEPQPPFKWEGDLVQDDNGAYVVDETDTSWGTVPKPMKLRVIVHNNDATTPVANLLQRVYIGNDDANGSLLLSTEPGLLPDATPDVRRVSAVHLPWSRANQPWLFTGAFGKGGTLATTVIVEHDDHASNPFLHTYHPDHDNLNARFEKKQSQGRESYRIKREITLRLNGSQLGFDGLSMGGTVLSGEYEERFTLDGTGNETRQFGMKGTVTFMRITPVANLRTE